MVTHEMFRGLPTMVGAVERAADDGTLERIRSITMPPVKRPSPES